MARSFSESWRLEEAIKERAKANQLRKPSDFVQQNSAEQTPIETREEIAKLAGVSRDTVDRIGGGEI